MPDVTSQINELKGLPDQALQSELMNPSGAAPAYLVLAEAQRRQLMRQSATTQQNQAPVGSVYDDVIRSMMARQPPPGASPAGMTPSASAPPAAPQTPQNFKPPTGMAEGGEVDDDDDEDGGGGFNLDDAINEVAQRHGRDPNEMRALVQAESSGNPKAVSPKGATGLLQLMPDTARQYGVKDSTDPMQNLEGGAKYLDALYDRYPDDPQLVHAAWNAGPGAVHKYGGVPPYPETSQFLKRVDNLMARAVKSERITDADDDGAGRSAPAQPFTSPDDWRAKQLAALQAPEAPAGPPANAAAMNPQLAAMLASSSPSPKIAPPAAPAKQAAASADPYDPANLNSSRDTYSDLYYKKEPPLTPDQQELRDRIQQMWNQAEAKKKPGFWQYLQNFGLGMASTPSRNWGQSLAGGVTGMVQGVTAQQEQARKRELELLGVSSKLDDQMREEQGKVGDAVMNQAKIQQQAINDATKAQEAQFEKRRQEAIKAFDESKGKAIYGRADDPNYKTLGFSFVPDPRDPSSGYWRHPDTVTVQPEMTDYLPPINRLTGKPFQPGDPMLWDDYGKIQDKAAQAQKELTVAGQKQNQNQKVTEYTLAAQALGIPDINHMSGADAQRLWDYKHNSIHLSDDAIETAAQDISKGGAWPNLGFGAAGAQARSQILNRLGELNGNMLFANRAAGKADAKTFSSLNTNMAALNAFEQTAGANLDMMLELSKPLVDSKVPWLNKPLRDIDVKALGDTDVPAYNAARQVALVELARVIGNPTLSGTLHRETINEIQNLVPENATLDQIYHVANVLKKDMVNRRIGLESEYNATLKRMQTPIGPGGPSNPPPAKPPAASKPEQNAPRAAQGGYKVNAVYRGLRYLGGDKNDPNSWQKVGQ